MQGFSKFADILFFIFIFLARTAGAPDRRTPGLAAGDVDDLEERVDDAADALPSDHPRRDAEAVRLEAALVPLPPDERRDRAHAHRPCRTASAAAGTQSPRHHHVGNVDGVFFLGFRVGEPVAEHDDGHADDGY